MFQEKNRIYWYLAGIVILMILLLLFGRDFVLPFLRGESTPLDRGPYIYDSPPSMKISKEENYFARFKTNYGDIIVDLFEKASPKNVNNFVFLSRQDYYDGTKFHRLIPDFLVQGGDRNTLDDDPINDGYGNPGYFIQDEVNWDSLDLSGEKKERLSSLGYESSPNLNSKHLRRLSLVMAKDINTPNTNGSQFFFVFADSSDPRLEELDGFFTVIGKVAEGEQVLKKISQIEVDNPNSQNPTPVKTILLKDVQIFVSD